MRNNVKLLVFASLFFIKSSYAAVFPISTDVTINSNNNFYDNSTVLEFLDAGKFIIPDGQTLTIQGNITAPLRTIFVCTGTGKVSFAGNKGLTEVYPQWWGAICNDSTDDWQSIENAITAAVTMSNDAVITFPAGIYDLLSSIEFSPRDKRIILNGYGATIRPNSFNQQYFPDGTPFFKVVKTDTTWNSGGITFKGFSLVNKKYNDSFYVTYLPVGIEINYAQNILIQDVFISGLKKGIVLRDVDIASIQNNKIYICDLYGIEQDNYFQNGTPLLMATSHRYVGNIISGNRQGGIKFRRGIRLLIEGNEIGQNSGFAISLGDVSNETPPAGQTYVVSPTIIHNRFEHNNDNLFIIGGGDGYVRNGLIEDNDILAAQNSIVFATKSSDGDVCRIINNNIRPESTNNFLPVWYNGALPHHIFIDNNCTINIPDQIVTNSGLFHIANTSNAEIRVSAIDGVNDRTAKLSLKGSGNGGAFSGGAVIDFTDSDDSPGTPGALQFVKSNSTYMTILNGGNVGIGTTGPAAKLDVVDANDATMKIRSTNSSNNRTATLQLIGGNGLDPASSSIIKTGMASGHTNFEKLQIQNSAATNLMTVQYNGAVGIGIPSPGSNLQVSNNVAIGYSTSTPAPANGLAVSGNVGIGTTNPSSKLQINGSLAIKVDTLRNLSPHHYNLADQSVIIVKAQTANDTLILPPAASVPNRNYFIVKASSTNTVFVKAASGEAINALALQSLTTQWQSYRLVNDGNKTWYLY